MSESEINNPNIFIKVHRISSDGTVSSFQIEEDFVTKKLVSKTPISSENVNWNSTFGKNCANDVDKVNSIVPYVDANDKPVTMVNIGDVENLNLLPYSTHGMESSHKTRIPVIPIMIRCQKCDINFPTKKQLEHHLCEFTADQLVLDSEKSSKKSLVTHGRLQQNLKSYVCEICDKSFAQASYLLQHMQFHQDIKRFGCHHEGCEARFSILIDLNDHVRKIHTHERPFKCTVCNKSFLTKSVYYQHRLIHTNDRRYSCEICDKRFLRSTALKNHLKIHTDERPFLCEICGKKFRQNGDRNKHVKTMHPDSL